MPKLTIDQREINVPAGGTILHAARRLGLEIPALCHLEQCRPNASCMVCMVKNTAQNRFVTACATPAEEGMRIESETAEVHALRKAALEMLLSDHHGECLAPCEAVCPAHLDIPLLMSTLAAGRFADAARLVREGLVLPGVLGHICPAPCQSGCRRSRMDQAPAIRAQHRLLAGMQPEQSPAPALKSSKRAAIAGAGPAGLAAAFALASAGIACTVFDQSKQAGGALRANMPETQLPRAVLDQEIERIAQMGVQFRFETPLGKAVSLEQLQREFDAVLLAMGAVSLPELQALGVRAAASALLADKHTLATGTPGVFAAGGLLSPRRFAVRSIGEGQTAAASVLRYLAGQPLTAPRRGFNLRSGRVEFPAKPRTEKPACDWSQASALDPAAASREGERCLQCGCREAETCKLRLYAEHYGAVSTRYPGTARQPAPVQRHGNVEFEAGKCISCGICVQLAELSGEKVGLAFIGRGFEMKLGVPFDAPFDQALTHSAKAAAQGCPTGALRVIASKL